MPESGARVIKSACFMCHICCGIDAHVEDGRLLAATPMKEHPFNRLCVKAEGMAEWLYSGDRVLSPLRKVNGEWQEVSWDEALDFIAGKLGRIREENGARALVIHLGEPLINTQAGRVAARFCSLFGTPNHTTGASVCFAARGIGHGLSYASQMSTLLPNYENTRCVVAWGFNPGQSNVRQAVKISQARKRGAKLIAVDPRATKLAKEADVYAQVKPGTDLALALGLLNVVIGEGLYDRDFVRDWTTGFDELADHVRGYTPEAVERMTWVPAEVIRELARVYASNRPAVIAQGVSLDHSLNGVQTSRAISMLIAICGNIDVLGGNVYYPVMPQTSLRVKGGVKISDAIGAKYPLFSRYVGQTTAMPVPGAILSGKPYPVKALIVQAANPALTWPDSGRVREALGRLDLLVVSDLFMTETAMLSDVFLPAAAFPERKTLKDYNFEGVPLISLAGQVVERAGDCRDDWEVWAELGRRLGYPDYFPWRTTDELLAHLIEPSGFTLAQLEQNPGGLMYLSPGRQQKYKEDGFGTASGKFELFSQVMAEYGYDPLPIFREPEVAPDDESRFILVSGPRVSAFNHSQHRNVPRLRRLVPEPLIEIHPASAGALGIEDGDPVTVTSARGSIRLRARLTEDIHPRVVAVQHGWNEANANILSDSAGDPISGFPAFRSIPCRIARA